MKSEGGLGVHTSVLVTNKDLSAICATLGQFGVKNYELDSHLPSCEHGYTCRGSQVLYPTMVP